jgi:integrase
MAETGYIKEDELERFLSVAMNFSDDNGKADGRPYVISTILLETGVRISEVVGEEYDYYTHNGHKVAPVPTEAEAIKNGYKHIHNKIKGLQIEDINFEEHKIFIRKAKGNKARIIPVSNHCLDAILAYLQSTGRSQGSQGQLVDVTTQWTRRLIDKITKKAKLRHFHPHLFRNTFSVRYLRRKGDIRALQKILGHVSLSVTEKYLKYVDQQVWDDYNEVMNKGPLA